MNKLLILLPLTLLLTACVDSLGVAKQDYICRNDGGVHKYAATRLKAVTCRSGEWFYNWQKVRLPPEYYPVVEEGARSESNY